jgi:hypothetical protein
MFKELVAEKFRGKLTLMGIKKPVNSVEDSSSTS